MDDARSDLLHVLTCLESHWTVLEAEQVEINRDILWCEQCVHKYGEYFTYPLQHLKELKKHKKQKMKEIVRAMESFNANLQGGKRLVKALERDVPITSANLSASGSGLNDSRRMEKATQG